jgi:hypothetical protein
VFAMNWASLGPSSTAEGMMKVEDSGGVAVTNWTTRIDTRSMKYVILELHITATVSEKQIKYEGHLGGLIVLVQRVFVVTSRMNPSAYANSVAQYDHELYFPKVY